MTGTKWAEVQAGAWWMTLTVAERWTLARRFPTSNSLEIMRAMRVEVPAVPHGWFKPCTCARCAT